MDPEALLSRPEIVAVRYLPERLPDARLDSALFRAPKRAQRDYDTLRSVIDQPLIDDTFATHTERRAFRDAIRPAEREAFERSLYRANSRTEAGGSAHDLLRSLKHNPYADPLDAILERLEEMTSTAAMDETYIDLVRLVAHAVGVTPEPRDAR